MAEQTKTMDELIEDLFKELNLKKEEVAKAEKPVFVTGGQFRYNEGISNTIDIMTIRDSRKLIEILVFLKERSKNYKEAASELGIDNPNFTWLGFTYDEWFNDLKIRSNFLNIAKRKAELADLEARLNRIVSPEQRAKMELAEISAALGK